jgi:hypothetical protein
MQEGTQFTCSKKFGFTLPALPDTLRVGLDFSKPLTIHESTRTMGDKSPKANQKAKTQKQTKSAPAKAKAAPVEAKPAASPAKPAAGKKK